MVKGKNMKPVARVVHVSTSRPGSPGSKNNDSLESDDSLFDDDIGRDENDDESAFDDPKDGDGDEEGAPKDEEGGGTTSDRKDSGEHGGKPARLLTMDEIRK